VAVLTEAALTPGSARARFLTGPELLAQRQDAVQRLYGLSATSETQFRVLYLPLLRAFAEAVQMTPSDKSGGHPLLEVRLRRAERGLRRRRGVILPPGADPEQAARTEDLWTYAVLNLALLRQLARDLDAWTMTLWSADDQPLGRWTPDSAATRRVGVNEALFYRLEPHPAANGSDWTPLKVGTWLPPAALNGLWREPEVFDVWQKALSRPELPAWMQSLLVD
jgi:hypothetical protein